MSNKVGKQLGDILAATPLDLPVEYHQSCAGLLDSLKHPGKGRSILVIQAADGDTLDELVQQMASGAEQTSGKSNQAARGIQNVNENVTQSSTVSVNIASDVVEVNQATTEMADGSAQVNTSAGELSELSENLKQIVEPFKI